MRGLMASLAPLVLVFAVSGCGIVNDLNNCIQICDNYQDCEDSDFDRTECVDACEARADFDDQFRDDADACENCLDDGSCAEQADRCASVCDPIINQAL